MQITSGQCEFGLCRKITAWSRSGFAGTAPETAPALETIGGSVDKFAGATAGAEVAPLGGLAGVAKVGDAGAGVDVTGGGVMSCCASTAFGETSIRSPPFITASPVAVAANADKNRNFLFVFNATLLLRSI